MSSTQMSECNSKQGSTLQLITPSVEQVRKAQDQIMVTIENANIENKVAIIENPIRVYDLYINFPQLFENNINDLLPVACTINNDLHALSDLITYDCKLQLIYPDSQLGSNIYRQSLIFLFSKVFHQQFPTMHLEISHSTGHSFYFIAKDESQIDVTENVFQNSQVNIEGANKQLTTDNLLKTEFKKLVSSNLPIMSKRPINIKEAIEIFTKQHFSSTVDLLKSTNEMRIFVSQCGDYFQLAQTPLVPLTSQLNIFDIHIDSKYLVLQYPSHHNPLVIQPFTQNKAITSLYQDYNDWAKTMEVTNIGQLNMLNRSEKFKPYIQICEARSNQMIQQVCDLILQGWQSTNGVTSITDTQTMIPQNNSVVIGKLQQYSSQIKLVLISGPSSSGKTTFAQKLQYIMSVHGRTPLVISMDNYFVDRELTPKDSKGNYDFEHLNALDLDLLNQQLAELLSGKQIQSPIFDFKTGKRSEKTKPLVLPQNGIVIMEGIHALNPLLTKSINKSDKFGIFIQPLPQINIDDVTRISTNDYRLLRRIIRDKKYRNFSAETTIQLFVNVRKGEERWVYPNAKRADVYFNTALDYELPVLSTYVTPLLNIISPDSPSYLEARRLLRMLDWVQGKNSESIPKHSLIREFIGDSGFRYD